ncbi:MAG: hypothetical protein ACRECH_03470 [Nitrososphaerales archaeon]
MKQRALSTVAIVLILAILVSIAFVGIYLSGFTHSQNQSVKLLGVCKVVSYFLPDTEQILVSNVTTTHGNTTSYYLSTYSTITATNETLESSTYTTTTYAKNTSGYVMTSTSNDLGAIPSAAWSVAVCTFAP